MSVSNSFYYAAGIAFLLLAKTKNVLKGYTTPKPFSLTEIERCVDYDIHIVERWIEQLKGYGSGGGSIAEQRILEIGPGSDLGVGLYLLAKGAQQYSAVDKHDLAASVPQDFYDSLLGRIERLNPACTMTELHEALALSRSGGHGRLNYAARDDFDICAVIPPHSIDIVFSNAAFEHIDDVTTTVRQLSRVVKPGGIAVIEVDMRTHSRWINHKDPNNIYRYEDWLYDLFRFPGTPNRVRPYQYRQYFAENGWTNIEISPATVLEPALLSRNASLARRFRGGENQMDYLTMILCATAPPAAPGNAISGGSR